MAVTININGISLVHRSSTGVTTVTVPDVCLTPSPGGPVPVGYSNVAFSKDLSAGTATVTADGGNMCAINGSQFSRSTGDEPGTAGGVASGTFIKESTWITYSFDVKLEGQGACRLTDKMFQNHGNAVDAAGAMNPVITGVLKKVCALMCEAIKEGKGDEERWMKIFKDKLAKSPKLMKALEAAGWKLEQKLALPVAEGAAEALGRKVMKQTAQEVLEKAAAKEAAAAGAKVLGEQVAKKALKSGATKLVGGLFGGPVTEAAMLAWTAYDLITIIPDLVQVVGGAVSSIGDLKFPGDSYRKGAKGLYELANDGKPPVTLDAKTCGC
jgi:hypothetical protein